MSLLKKKKKKKMINADDDYISYDGGGYAYDDDYNNGYDSFSDSYGDDEDQESFNGNKGRKKRNRRRGPKRKNGGGTLQNVVIIAAVSVAVFLIYYVTMCFIGPRRGECKELINEVQTYCNDMNVKGLVNCLDPVISKKLTPIIVGGEILTGGDLQSVLRTIARDLGMDFGNYEDYESFFQTLQIKPVRYGLPLPTRKVRCKVEILGIERTMNLMIGKKHGEVYLSKAKFLN